MFYMLLQSPAQMRYIVRYLLVWLLTASNRNETFSIFMRRIRNLTLTLTLILKNHLDVILVPEWNPLRGSQQFNFHVRFRLFVSRILLQEHKRISLTTSERILGIGRGIAATPNSEFGQVLALSRLSQYDRNLIPAQRVDFSAKRMIEALINQVDPDNCKSYYLIERSL